MNAIKKLGSLILVLAISLPCFAKKKVELIGRWDLKTKSITFQLPVQTWVQDNNKDLLLEFTADLGTVQVTVTNSAGEVVYNQSIVTKPSVVISLDEEAKNYRWNKSCIWKYIYKLIKYHHEKVKILFDLFSFSFVCLLYK